MAGIPGLIVEALDVDAQAKTYFAHHPELAHVQFHLQDFLVDDLPRRYDVIVCRGVFHHVPKRKRPSFLKAMCDHARIVIVADEGIREYADEKERIRNCESWYGYVVGEARRRGLDRLAEMESRFLEHERLATADDGLDYKESPTDFLRDAELAGLAQCTIDRQGPWDTAAGGFFTATFVTDAQGSQT